jgi:hypothetical protein
MTALHTQPSIPPARPPLDTRLQVLCVGTGRDGTMSVSRMVQALFDAEGRGRQCFHEYGARALYQAYCSWRETGEERYLDEIDTLIRDCPYDAVVGNGYAPILHLLEGRLPSSVRIIHLRRRSKPDCVASLVKDAQLFPQAYRYYTSDSAEHSKRIAAFHYGEATRAQWDAAPLEARFDWYYRKTHALIDAAKGRFAASLDLATEDLDRLESRQALAGFIVGGAAAAPPPVRVNGHVHLATDQVAEEHRLRVQWLFGHLNIHDVLADDAHLVRYAIDRYVTWTGYQVTGQIGQISPADIRSPQEIMTHLRSVRRALHDCDATLSAWERELGATEPLPGMDAGLVECTGIADPHNQGFRVSAQGSRTLYTLSADSDAFALSQYDGNQWRHALRVERDRSVTVGGGPVFDDQGIATLRSFQVAALPAPNPAGRLIHVSDGGDGRRLAVSDGDCWRWTDGTQVA